jgi:hypothetical protein
MDTIGSLLYGIANGNYEKAEKCGHDIVGDYTLDSCDTVDQGFETAIWKNDNNIIIVERYENAELCREGHQKWCEFCKANPKEVYSVQTGEIEQF